MPHIACQIRIWLTSTPHPLASTWVIFVMLRQGVIAAQDPGVDATSQQAPSVEDEEEPCYVELGMREEGDRRLASMYKPEKRSKLQVSV